MSGHLWSAWKFSLRTLRWSRHCTHGSGFCTAKESAPRGHKPTA